MPAFPSDDAYIHRYLLDQLPPDERAALEQAMWENPALFEQVEKSEEGLLIQYVKNQLTGPLQERVRELYSETAPRRSRVDAVRVLHTAPVHAPLRRPPLPRWWVAAGVTAVLASTLVLLVPRAMQNPEQTEVALLTLDAGADTIQRGAPAAVPQLVLKPAARTARLTLRRPVNALGSATVTIAPPDNKSALVMAVDAPAGGSPVIVELNVRELTSDHYLVELKDEAGNPRESWSFEVVRR